LEGIILAVKVTLRDDRPIGRVQSPQPPPEQERQEHQPDDDKGLGEPGAPSTIAWRHR
jgi:hypothetical protein